MEIFKNNPNKKFLKFAAILVVATALLSIIFSILYAVADLNLDEGTTVWSLAYYFKRFFDIFAIFAGYGIIIFAFSRYDAETGKLSIAVFSLSIILSFLYQLIGTFIYEGSFNVDFLVYSLYYSCGYVIITQLLPAIFAAYITHRLTKKGTRGMDKLLNFKNPIQKAMLIITLVVFALNLLFTLLFTILPDLIAYEFIIPASFFWDIVLTIVDIIVVYLIIQYLIYFVIYKVCEKNS